MKNEESTALTNQEAVDVSNITIGVNTDVSSLSIEDRAILLQRWTEARAAEKIDDRLLQGVHTVTGLTVYEVDFLDQETGEIGLATYVAFELADGTQFKSASAYAAGFARAVANILGYDPKSGKLPQPILMQITTSAAPTGRKYNFVFKGLAK